MKIGRWIRTAGLATALGSVALVASAEDCRHTRTLEVKPLDASGVQRVVIDAAAGGLDVRGGASSIVRARGKACASSAVRLDHIELEVVRRGDEIRITAETSHSSSSLFRRSYATLDLSIELPSGIEVEIDDGSGSIEVSDVGALTIDDGSGSIVVRNAGTTRIDDGSGDIELRLIRGDVEIEDGSGEIVVAGVSGTVRIDDGSGRVEITDVGGHVIVDDDGSGSIRVTDVRGDLRVADHGSGGISYDRVGGKVTIRD